MNTQSNYTTTTHRRRRAKQRRVNVYNVFILNIFNSFSSSFSFFYVYFISVLFVKRKTFLKTYHRREYFKRLFERAHHHRPPRVVYARARAIFSCHWNSKWMIRQRLWGCVQKKKTFRIQKKKKQLLNSIQSSYYYYYYFIATFNSSFLKKIKKTFVFFPDTNTIFFFFFLFRLSSYGRRATHEKRVNDFLRSRTGMDISHRKQYRDGVTRLFLIVFIII